MNISTQNNTLNYLNGQSDKILAKIGEVGESYEKGAISGALQTANEKISTFLDIKDIASKETPNLSWVKKSLRTGICVFDAVTGVLDVASELNKDIKSGDTSYCNTMFAVTKSTFQTMATIAGATAATALVAGAISGGAVLAVAVAAGAATGYLVGKFCDWARGLGK